MKTAFITWLKWRIAGDELAELERRRIAANSYRHWLAEFPSIALTLDNIEAEARGDAMSLCWPPSDDAGPWDISRFREVLRRRVRADDARGAAMLARIEHLGSLLDEALSTCTTDDDLPDGLVGRIDLAINAKDATP